MQSAISQSFHFLLRSAVPVIPIITTTNILVFVKVTVKDRFSSFIGHLCTKKLATCNPAFCLTKCCLSC